MLGHIKKIFFLIALFLTIVFTLFIINQTSQVVTLAANIHPVLGQAVLFTLLAVYAAVLIIPLVSIFRKPITIFPPEDTESEAYRIFLHRLAKRLSKNPNIESSKIDPHDLPALEEAMKSLNKEADKRIKEAASAVFIMTAISQYGALDAIIVILAQFRMIWQVTMLYNQRPNLRELAYLYGNVFATAFLASKIENLDLLEDQLEPVIASIMGSSLSSLTPAFNTAATVITNAVIQGSANAFLTLRVGIIARKYCSSLVRQEKSSLRRTAMAQAAALLAIVLGESTYDVTKAVLRATAKTGKRPFRFGRNLIVSTTKKTVDAGKSGLRRGEELAKDFGGAVKDGGRKIKRYFIKPKPQE